MSTTQEPLSIEVSNELLNTTEPYAFDESFRFKSYVPIQPSSQNIINVPGPIILNSFHQDGYFYPAESYLSIKGRLLKADGTGYDNEEVTLVNNAMMYLFSEMKYSISDTEIESILYPGQATTLFGLLSLPDDFSTSSGLSRCWSKDTNSTANSTKYSASVAAPAA